MRQEKIIRTKLKQVRLDEIKPNQNMHARLNKIIPDQPDQSRPDQAILS